MIVEGATAEIYRDLAVYARHTSPCFHAWATGVAGDEELLAWIDAHPASKRQPTLVFAAARWHGVPAPGPFERLRAALLEDDGTIRDTILRRSTQTNEVGRLATLLPALALAGPRVRLLELGSSAGVCLHPDRYRYRWRTGRKVREAGNGPVLETWIEGPVPLPGRFRA